MKRFATWVLCALTLGLSTVACDDDQQEAYPDMERRFAEITIVSEPQPLEAVGGKVPVTMTLTIPPRFLWPEAEVSVVPCLTWDGDEAKGQAFGFQGERAPDMGGTVIPFEQGGSLTAKTAYDFRPEMKKSILMLEFTVRYRGRTTVFRIQAGEGVISS